ncbi:hypothetical protein ABEX78_20940 [Priestia megaterium]
MLKNRTSRNLFLIGLLVLVSFLYVTTSNQIKTIKNNNYELFSSKVKPTKIENDCYSSTGLSKDQECDQEETYSAENQYILDERESKIGLWDDVKTVCMYIGVIALIALLYFLWADSVDKQAEKELKFQEELNSEKKLAAEERERKRELIEHYARKEAKRSKYLEEIVNLIKTKESNNEFLTLEEVKEIRKNEHYTSKVNNPIKKHMKKYNPHWR